MPSTPHPPGHLAPGTADGSLEEERHTAVAPDGAADPPLLLGRGATVVAVDGTDAGRAAIAHAARDLPQRPLLVVCLWRPADPVLGLATEAGATGALLRATAETDRARRSDALARACEGVALAQELGVTARPLAVRVPYGISEAASLAAVVRRRGGAHLVLPATAGRRRLRRRGTAERLAAAPPCAVVIVPAEPMIGG